MKQQDPPDTSQTRRNGRFQLHATYRVVDHKHARHLQDGTAVQTMAFGAGLVVKLKFIDGEENLYEHQLRLV